MKFSSIIKASRNAKRFSLNEKKPGASKSSTSRDPKSTKIKMAYPKIGEGAAGQFEDSPVDLTNIENAYYTDSYISRAVDKVSGLMFKSGWELTSKNNDALEYVQTRLKLIEESTDISTEELLKELGHNYVAFANAPMIKVRGTDNLGGLNATGYYGGDPIAGIFPAPPSKFKIMRDDNGNLEKYQIESDGGGENPEFKIEDVFFYTYQKPTGRGYGVPYYQNVLDDVLILRQIEENVARLIHKNLHPLQAYTVGQAKEGFEATDIEIEQVREVIDNMPLDGMIVIPERHKVENITSANDNLNAENYLKYFRQRVFTGLAMSESTMGIGDTANRSTSDNQSSDLVDLVKNFQASFRAQIQRTLINELLFEGGYDPTLNKDDEVNFNFVEIDSSSLIKKQNSISQLFTQNLIDINEARIALNLEPTEDFSKFYFQLIKEANNMGNQVDNQNMPENQHGKQSGPKKQKNQVEALTESEKVVNLNIDTETKKNLENIKLLFYSFKDDISIGMKEDIDFNDLFILTTNKNKGKLEKLIFNTSYQYIESNNKESLKIYKYLKEESIMITENLFKELEFRILNKSEDITIEEVFDFFSKKIEMITKEEVIKGINYNYYLEQIDNKNYIIRIECDNNNCSECNQFDYINLNDEGWHLNIPPCHQTKI